MGFSFFAGLGNQADLNESNLLDAAADDPDTRVILAYLEGVAHGRRLFETLRAIAGRKPVVVLKDTVTRRVPLSHGEALEMLDELRMAPLLRGVRGEPPVNRSALAETICRFAQLAMDEADLREIELDPLVASPSGVVAVDARGTLE